MPDINRSRWIREIVLTVLWAEDGSGMGQGLDFEKVLGQFARSRMEVSESDVRRELNDMVDDELIKRRWDKDLRAWFYKIISRGREFYKAKMPWERIDEFTGKQP